MMTQVEAELVHAVTQAVGPVVLSDQLELVEALRKFVDERLDNLANQLKLSGSFVAVVQQEVRKALPFRPGIAAVEIRRPVETSRTIEPVIDRAGEFLPGKVVLE